MFQKTVKTARFCRHRVRCPGGYAAAPHMRQIKLGPRCQPQPAGSRWPGPQLMSLKGLSWLRGQDLEPQGHSPKVRESLGLRGQTLLPWGACSPTPKLQLAFRVPAKSPEIPAGFCEMEGRSEHKYTPWLCPNPGLQVLPRSLNKMAGCQNC